MKLTKAQVKALRELHGRLYPMQWTGPNKAMGNKLVKMGLATYSAVYPLGFTITAAGIDALSEPHHAE